MIYQDVELHNVAEVEESWGGGVRLYRFPRQVRHALSERGRFIAEEAIGAEIRFVTAAANVRVSLCIPETEGLVTVYKGGLFHSQHRLQAGVRHTLHLEEPVRLAGVDRSRLLQSGFAPEVWRIGFGRHTCELYGVHAFGHTVRPPAPGEVPSRKWLAYGSSITHGLTNYQLSYVHQAARRLQADVYNLGMSGSCHCEREVADHIAGRDDWDWAMLELGVNMRDRFTPDQFRIATGYLLERVTERHPDKHVFVITIYPNFATFGQTEVSEKDKAFNDILREHVLRLQPCYGRLHVIEGADVLTDPSGLSCDLIHPGEIGNILMGERLAAIMQKVVG